MSGDSFERELLEFVNNSPLCFFIGNELNALPLYDIWLVDEKVISYFLHIKYNKSQ